MIDHDPDPDPDADDAAHRRTERQWSVPPGHPPQGRRGDVVVTLGTHDPERLLHHVKQQLPSLIDTPPAALVVDLSGMRRLSSGAVAALLWMGCACRTRGIPVRLREVPPGGDATLRRTGVGMALALDESRP